MPLEFIVSEKGHGKLLTDGYPFVKDRMSGTKISRLCIAYHTYCGTIRTDWHRRLSNF